MVPANSFAEYAPEPNPETRKKDVVWFALNEDRPLCAFAGLWAEFRGDRGTKSKPIPGPHLVYGILTTAPNAVVEPIHPKASIVADWFSGKNGVGYFTPGISITLPGNGLFNAGYSFGNDSWENSNATKNRYVFLYYEVTF